MDKAVYWAFVIVVIFGLFFWYMVAHSLYDIQVEKQRSFVSDGCTFFVEGSWGTCCSEHDRAYWKGGNAQQRVTSDKKFHQCILHTTNNKAFALVAYGIVRTAGVPYIATTWRWGYGWSFGRGYR